MVVWNFRPLFPYLSHSNWQKPVEKNEPNNKGYNDKKILLKAMANNIRSHIRGVVIDSKNMRREIDSEKMK